MSVGATSASLIGYCQPWPASECNQNSQCLLANKGIIMKAIAVKPGRANTVHLTELPAPKVADIPDGRGVLVRVLRVGVDGTDKEINAAEYGQAPQGYDFLIIGHESFGQVEAVGPNVTEVKPGDYVVATVRRPGSSIYDVIGTNDMTTDDTYFERGIKVRPEQM